MRNSLNYIFVLTFLFLGLSACNGVDTSADDNDFDALYEQLDTLKEELALSDEGNWRNFFQIKVPEPMFEMDQLNPEAIAQYGYIEEVQEDSAAEAEVLEHYLIVMMEEKAEMENYQTDIEWDALSYYHNVTQSLRESKDEFDEVIDDPEMTLLNGLNSVQNEAIAGMRVRDEWIELFYELAIVEGDHAFYQIITWCPKEQREIFETDMELIIKSFKEKASDADHVHDHDAHDHDHDHDH